MKKTLQQLIKQDVAEIVQDALKNVATKDDLKSYATKDDLKRFATKDDLKNYPTKDDLNEAVKNLASKNDLITFKDAILHEIAKLRDEGAIVGGQRDMVEDHELRIETIEKHLHIAPPAQ